MTWSYSDSGGSSPPGPTPGDRPAHAWAQNRPKQPEKTPEAVETAGRWRLAPAGALRQGRGAVGWKTFRVCDSESGPLPRPGATQHRLFCRQATGCGGDACAGGRTFIYFQSLVVVWYLKHLVDAYNFWFSRIPKMKTLPELLELCSLQACRIGSTKSLLIWNQKSPRKRYSCNILMETPAKKRVVCQFLHISSTMKNYSFSLHKRFKFHSIISEWSNLISFFVYCESSLHLT